MIRNFNKGDVGREVMFIQRMIGAKQTGVYDAQTCTTMSNFKENNGFVFHGMECSADLFHGFISKANSDELPMLFSDPLKEWNVLSADGIRKDVVQRVMDEVGMGNIEADWICAIMEVECGTDGFDPKTGKIKIQFEPYWFNHYENVRIANGVSNQKDEYDALFEAANIDVESALLSTSFGLGQVMGFNHKLAGYETVTEMVMDFCESEEKQLKGMLNFIGSKGSLVNACVGKDAAAFAYVYNGKNYKKFNYDTKIQDAYNRIIGKKD